VGAPVSEIKAGEAQSAEIFLDSFKSIAAAERRRHATVLNYWLSIKGDKDVAAIRDLDPLEISDAGPHSLLIELIGGGEDGEVKHSGDALKDHVTVDRLSAAPSPSLLSCIAGKLAIVGISRNVLAFEDEFSVSDQTVRCWGTLLPFSSTGVWVDYVYALVSVEGETAVGETADTAVEAVGDEEVADVPATVAEEEVPVEDALEEVAVEPEPQTDELAPEPEPEPEPEPVMEVELDPEPVMELNSEPVMEAEPEPEPETASEKRPGFSKIVEALAGYHGTNVRAAPVLPPVAQDEFAEPEPAFEPETVETPEGEAEEILELESAEPVEPEESVAEDIVDERVEEPAVSEAPAPVPSQSVEGPLQSKLEEVRVKADEARQAKLRSNLALYEGLSAAYDFALDAEGSPEEYLRLVEAQGLKIQLRSPMTPVVKLAFDGLCDDATIGQLEAVLAWALKQDLPRGTLAEKIEAAGGIGPIINGQAAA
jgi:hypothetical protein